MRLVNRVVSPGFLALLLIVGAAPAFAQDDLVVKKPVDRRFPQGQFCGLPIDFEFTSPGTSVRVVFEARVFVFDANDNQFHWTEQAIDNVTLCDATTFDAHAHPAPEGSASELCYIDPGPPNVPFLYFNDAGIVTQLKELFDTDPTGRGWDMTHGGSFSSRSAPRHPELVSETVPIPGGSLGLGQDSPSPTGTEVASTEITINGLTQGQNYNLGAWWNVQYVIFNNPDTMLTISVYGPQGTPVVRKSWGGLKQTYR